MCEYNYLFDNALGDDKRDVSFLKIRHRLLKVTTCNGIHECRRLGQASSPRLVAGHFFYFSVEPQLLLVVFFFQDTVLVVRNPADECHGPRWLLENSLAFLASCAARTAPNAVAIALPPVAVAKRVSTTITNPLGPTAMKKQ